MNKIIISTDSVSDLSPQILQEYNIPVFPLTINLGDESKDDGPHMPGEIYAYVARTGKTPKTAARGEEKYLEFFTKHKPEGGEIVHFCLSHKISASYQNASAAAQKIDGVHVVDSYSLSTGAGLNVMYALDLRNEGLSAAEIAQKCRDRVGAVQASFIINSLEYLHKGGRCSGLSLLFSNILSIKPMILLKDGEMHVGKKYIAKFEKALFKYVDDILNTYNTPDLTRLFITHTEISNDLVEQVKARVLARYPFKTVYDTLAGGTITSHCGKSTLGILYFNDTDESSGAGMGI